MLDSQEGATNTGQSALSFRLFLQQVLIGKPGEYAEKPLLWCWLGRGRAASAEPPLDPLLYLSFWWAVEVCICRRRAQNCSQMRRGSPARGAEWRPPPKLSSDPFPLSFLRKKALIFMGKGNPNGSWGHWGHPLSLEEENKRKQKALPLREGAGMWATSHSMTPGGRPHCQDSAHSAQRKPRLNQIPMTLFPSLQPTHWQSLSTNDSVPQLGTLCKEKAQSPVGRLSQAEGNFTSSPTLHLD